MANRVSNSFKDRESTECGFTLVELLTTMVIIGIMSAIAIPQLGQQLQKWHLNKFSRSVTTAHRTARFYALSEQREIQVRYDLDNEKITFWKNKNQGYDNSNENWTRYNRMQTMKAPDVVDIYSAGDETSGEACIVFKRNGTSQNMADRSTASGEECPGAPSERLGEGLHLTYKPNPDPNNEPCKFRTVYVVTNNAKPFYLNYGAYPGSSGPFQEYNLGTAPSDCDKTS
ncbi:MAG: Tfp pilus assembly protein FimT/FimU [bacterium]